MSSADRWGVVVGEEARVLRGALCGSVGHGALTITRLGWRGIPCALRCSWPHDALCGSVGHGVLASRLGGCPGG